MKQPANTPGRSYGNPMTLSEFISSGSATATSSGEEHDVVVEITHGTDQVLIDAAHLEIRVDGAPLDGAAGKAFDIVCDGPTLYALRSALDAAIWCAERSVARHVHRTKGVRRA